MKISIEDAFTNEELDEFIIQNPGKNNYVCEFCGVYTADKPFCTHCEKEED